MAPTVRPLHFWMSMPAIPSNSMKVSIFLRVSALMAFTMTTRTIISRKASCWTLMEQSHPVSKAANRLKLRSIVGSKKSTKSSICLPMPTNSCLLAGSRHELIAMAVKSTSPTKTWTPKPKFSKHLIRQWQIQNHKPTWSGANIDHPLMRPLKSADVGLLAKSQPAWGPVTSYTYANGSLTAVNHPSGFAKLRFAYGQGHGGFKTANCNRNYCFTAADPEKNRNQNT